MRTKVAPYGTRSTVQENKPVIPISFHFVSILAGIVFSLILVLIFFIVGKYIYDLGVQAGYDRVRSEMIFQQNKEILRKLKSSPEMNML